MKEKNRRQHIAYHMLLMIITWTLWYSKAPFWIGTLVYSMIFFILVYFKRSVFWMIPLVFYSVFHYYGQDAIVKTHHVITGLIVIYEAIRIFKRKRFVVGAIGWHLIAIIAFVLLSITWAPDPLFSAGGMGVIAQGYLLYFVVINEKQTFDFLDLSIFSTVYLILISSILTILAIRHQGFSHLIGDSGSFKQFFGNPNVIFSIMAMLIPISIGKYFLIKDKRVWLMMPLDLYFVFAVLLTDSRGLLFAMAGALIMSIIVLLKPNKKMLAVIFIGGLIAFYGFILWTLSIQETHPDLFKQINDFSSGRFHHYKIALDTWSRSLFDVLFGTGVRSSFYYNNHGKSMIGAIYPVISGGVYYHSFLLQILSTLGLIGMALYAGLFIKIFKIVTKNTLQHRLILIGIISYLIQQLVDVSFELQYIGAFYYILIAYLENQNKQIEALEVRG